MVLVGLFWRYCFESANQPIVKVSFCALFSIPAIPRMKINMTFVTKRDTVIWGDYPEISEKMAEANRLEAERYEEDTEMMRRIISVREYMWT